MPSGRLVLWLMAVACACDTCTASDGGPQQTLLSLVKALQSRPESEPRWSKRSDPGGTLQEGTPLEEGQGEAEVVEGLQKVSSSFASNFLRHARSSQRPYDVPQIECPPAEDQMERFPCPSPDRMGRYRCIDDHLLCDGFIDCPDGEDEDRQQCMFYQTTKAHLDILADAIIRWARGRK